MSDHPPIYPGERGDWAAADKGYARHMAKRGYSREFTPKTDRRVQIVIDRVPPTLKDAVDAKAKREGISVRALVLTLLKDWLTR
jgi:hypothetical protein